MENILNVSSNNDAIRNSFKTHTFVEIPSSHLSFKEFLQIFQTKYVCSNIACIGQKTIVFKHIYLKKKTIR